jgi:hypothetical protein
MGADPGADAGEPITQHPLEPVDRVGLAGERAAGEDEDRPRLDPVDLLAERFGKRLAKDDAVHRRETINAAQHRLLLLLGDAVL